MKINVVLLAITTPLCGAMLSGCGEEAISCDKVPAKFGELKAYMQKSDAQFIRAATVGDKSCFCEYTGKLLADVPPLQSSSYSL